MKVTFFATLRQIVGQKDIDITLGDTDSLQDLIAELLHKYPALQPELMDESGVLSEHIHIFINGMESSFLEKGMETILGQNDAVGIFPAIGGG